MFLELQTLIYQQRNFLKLLKHKTSKDICFVWSSALLGRVGESSEVDVVESSWREEERISVESTRLIRGAERRTLKKAACLEQPNQKMEETFIKWHQWIREEEPGRADEGRGCMISYIKCKHARFPSCVVWPTQTSQLEVWFILWWDESIKAEDVNNQIWKNMYIF